jgi:hypothetical protein
MTTEQLQGAIHATPFVPFVIKMADGQEFRVPHRDLIMHRPGARTAVVWMPDDSIRILDLLLATTLNFPPPRPAKPRRKS